MCGRFAQFNPVDILKARFDIETIAGTVAPCYNIAPGREVAVLAQHQGLRLGTLSWGFTAHDTVKDRKPGLLINARAETLMERRTFKEAFLRRRCLIVADGFYEWKKEGKARIPYYFHLPDYQPFAFAGLWDTFHEKDGSTRKACVIITRSAEGPIRDVHHRMPAIVSMDRLKPWLSADSGAPAFHEKILSDHCVTDLQYHRVSSQVNAALFDSPLCIEAAE